MAITIQLAAGPSTRELLTADRTYYVRTDGSDSNNGLTNTAGGAFATFAKAITAISAIDGNGHNITIQGNNATHTDAININVPIVGVDNLTIDVAGGTISSTTTDCIAINIALECVVQIQNVTLTTSSGNCITGGALCHVVLGSSVVFGAASSAHMAILAPSSNFVANVNYSITGNAQQHVSVFASPGSIFSSASNTVTLTSTPAFSSAFVLASHCGVAKFFSNTYSGNATGQRYSVFDNGVIDTNGGGANYFPGNTAGFSGSGGQYV